MVCIQSKKAQSVNLRNGFTLMELLVVLAVISLLMAIILPALRRIRIASDRLVCQSNLRQIAIAWDMYLINNDEIFLKGPSANHEFGGWEGVGGYALHRPLNGYVSLPLDMNSPDGAEIFRCPSDCGGILGCPPLQLAYDYFGNSYQTNYLLIGPVRIFEPPGPLGTLHKQINSRIKQLKCSNVDNPSHLILVGDNGWVNQWLPSVPHRISWHYRQHHHNLAFLDGHVDFVHIRKGLYVTDEYTVLPFKDLYGIACEVQEEEFED
jgi:prepilin-type N-terminal cleavage/methylation domain-containing protein